MDFGDLSENPFAAQLAVKPRARRRAFKAAAELLLLVAAGLSLTLVLTSQSRRWLVHRMTHDFTSLSAMEKQARLTELADLGPTAIEPLVEALADDDLEVARTAYQLLRRAQNEWTVLDPRERQRCHEHMVDALCSVAVYIPDDRTGWGANLLQQTLMTTVDRGDTASGELYRKATSALERLALSDRSGPSVLIDEPLDPEAPKRLTIQNRPLPVTTRGAESDWTDWPPPLSAAQPIRSRPAAAIIQTPAPPIRATAQLQAAPPGDPVILRNVGGRHDAGDQPAETAPAEIQSVTHLLNSPLETLQDYSVIQWLANPHPTLREKARLELTSRGYDDEELAIATQIATCDTRARVELVDVIARSSTTDPRPWLLMMLGDPNRDVKLRVISVLATMNDPGIRQRLRTLLVDQHDPTVAARIRRVLDLR